MGSDPLRIVFLISSLGSGGAERVASTLSNAWVARGDQVTLVPTFSGGGQPFYELDPRVEVRYLADEIGGPVAGGSGKRYLSRLLALRRLIRARQPDLVLSFLPNVNIAALVATAFTGIPCIVSERSDPSMLPIGRVWSLACRLFYRFADAVTVQTEAVAGRIGSIYPGLRRVAVMPNPLPAALEAEPPRDPDQPAASSRRVLLSVGRLAPEKRTDLIINSFARLAAAYPDWDLHLVGDGPLRADLQRQIDATGLPQQRIRLLGRSTEPWVLMRQADAFVLASDYEGFPNALLEALALGLPAVSTDCRSGPRELSDDGTVVELVPPGDGAALQQALSTLIGDAALRRRLGVAGAASVRRRYGLAQVLGLWDALFAQILKPTSKEPGA
jgi:GalNAc-alpha-(1->4)-GalNAc-alpha-(1->3)-diNAcBac-PP-undecaprenol alpha-1,4-N-acetyl-D-galactosaminyltransferase